MASMPEDNPMLAAVEFALFECGEWLRSATPSPSVREFRLRHGALVRVVGGWHAHPPHAAQVAAMLECAQELHAVVARARRSSSFEASRVGSRPPARKSTAMKRPVQPTSRPPARRDPKTLTTRPPPKPAPGGAR
jgi:hypothetical protein